MSKVLQECPHFVRSQLDRHITSAIRMASKGAEHANELDLIDAEGIPDGGGVSDEVLHKAVSLLEVSGDTLGLVHLLKWQMMNSLGAAPAVALLANLRTVRAMDLTVQVCALCFYSSYFAMIA